MRRKSRSKKIIDHSIPSPCVSVCQFKKHELICKGCYRSQDEVRNWMIMSQSEKLESLAKVALRREQTKL